MNIFFKKILILYYIYDFISCNFHFNSYFSLMNDELNDICDIYDYDNYALHFIQIIYLCSR